MDILILIGSLALVVIGLWRAKFWPKTLIASAVFVFLGIIVSSSWSWIFSKECLISLLIFFSISILAFIVRYGKNENEKYEDKEFAWFLLALVSAVVVFADMIVLSFRFNPKWYIWLPIFLAYIIFIVFKLARINSDRKKELLVISLSVYILAVAGLATLILT